MPIPRSATGEDADGLVEVRAALPAVSGPVNDGGIRRPRPGTYRRSWSGRAALDSFAAARYASMFSTASTVGWSPLATPWTRLARTLDPAAWQRHVVAVAR
jgi:hypothetical protein